jgi:hypothetical protein
MFIIVVSNNDLEQKLILNLPCTKGVQYHLCCIGHVCGMPSTEPLTKLTTIWLDNIMDGVPPEDVTSCSLSVIVPCHGHLAKQHSTTMFISGVYFFFCAQGFTSRADCLVCLEQPSTCLQKILPCTSQSLLARTSVPGLRR